MGKITRTLPRHEPSSDLGWGVLRPSKGVSVVVEDQGYTCSVNESMYDPRRPEDDDSYSREETGIT